MILSRTKMLEQARFGKWDVLVIGGGATGLGIALDSATRGLKTILVEQSDFAKSTSSRSTKLVHGGVRYLQQGDVALVREALRERGRMLRNAPHLVRDMRFIIGGYRWWEQAFYAIGLTFYDLLAGSLGLGRSLPLSKSKVLSEIPSISQDKLRGGVVYHDGQFDDARMAITLALSAQDAGATCLNYLRVLELNKSPQGKICGAKVCDELTGKKFDIDAKIVINATGVFVDNIMIMDAPETSKKVRPSQGVHLVVDSSFLGGDSALMIPKTDDGRVLFGVPWHNKVILGTTDTPLNEESLEPRALEEEVDFILNQAGKYLVKKPTRKDVLCVFAGLRPLAAPSSADLNSTKEISRSHKIYISDSNLVSITGGKWTTYRVMAEDVLNKALKLTNLKSYPCCTADLKLHGYKKNVDRSNWNYVYGSDIEKIKSIENSDPTTIEKIHKDYSFTKSQVVFAVRYEFAHTVEDVLARRVRLLFLDARAAKESACIVAEILAKELNKDKEWQSHQVAEFNKLADGYILS